MTVPRFVLILFAMLAMTFSAACADGGEDSDADIEVGDMGDVPASVETEAQVVGIELFDDSIEVPELINSNIRSFRLANLGGENHSLAIRGEGIDVRFDEEVEPENRKVYTLEEQLPAGTYEFSCPLEGHAVRGETIQVMVQN